MIVEHKNVSEPKRKLVNKWSLRESNTKTSQDADKLDTENDWEKNGSHLGFSYSTCLSTRIKLRKWINSHTWVLLLLSDRRKNTDYLRISDMAEALATLNLTTWKQHWNLTKSSTGEMSFHFMKSLLTKSPRNQGVHLERDVDVKVYGCEA